MNLWIYSELYFLENSGRIWCIYPITPSNTEAFRYLLHLDFSHILFIRNFFAFVSSLHASKYDRTSACVLKRRLITAGRITSPTEIDLKLFGPFFWGTTWNNKKKSIILQRYHEYLCHCAFLLWLFQIVPEKSDRKILKWSVGIEPSSQIVSNILTRRNMEEIFSFPLFSQCLKHILVQCKNSVLPCIRYVRTKPTFFYNV